MSLLFKKKETEHQKQLEKEKEELAAKQMESKRIPEEQMRLMEARLPREEKQRLIIEEQRHREQEEECIRKSEEANIFAEIRLADFSKQENQIRDAWGRRWVQCKICKKKGRVNEFNRYGGTGANINLGICNECKNKPEVNNVDQKNESIQPIFKNEKSNNFSDICPDCGGKLVERIGKYGVFYGCENYPKCRFTKNKETK